MLKMPEMYVTKKFIKFIHTHIKEATNGGKNQNHILQFLVLKIHLKFIIIRIDSLNMVRNSSNMDGITYPGRMVLVRNFTDTYRYNLLEKLQKLLNLIHLK